VTGGQRVVLLARTVDEVGGLQRVLHTLAAGFVDRGHLVELIGMMSAPPGARLQHGSGYRTTVLNNRPEHYPWRPVTATDVLRADRWAKEVVRRRQHRRPVARLRERLLDGDPPIVISGQVGPMDWLTDTHVSPRAVVGMSHESYDAARSREPDLAPWIPTRYERIQRHYREVDRFLVLTEEDAARYRADGFGNVGVMPNPVPIWPEQPSPLSEPVVVAVGRLAPEKRFDLLLEVWRRVSARVPGWRLHIVGDGPLREALQAQIGRLQLGDEVTLVGHVDDVTGWLTGSSIFALSSEREGLPLAAAEALAAGLPVVAFDCAPGVRALVRTGQDGLVVPPLDVTALADALASVMEDADLRRRLGAHGRRSAQAWSLPVVLDRWEALFDEVAP
jgi:glycosyltransferase involved in cell wall biosynthesis